MRVSVRQEPLHPWQEIARYERRLCSRAGCHGATSTFVGTMRDYNQGAGVSALLLEHYPGMTERHLERICVEARTRWRIIDVLLVHRVGEITPGETIVLVAVWAAHRGPAFEACRYVIEQLKSRAPFWKRETVGSESRQRWVGASGPDQDASLSQPLR